MKNPLPYALTQYGFDWGPISIKRCCSHNGTAVVTVKTAKGIIQIQATKSGKTYLSVWSAKMDNSFKAVAKISSKIRGWETLCL